MFISSNFKQEIYLDASSETSNLTNLQVVRFDDGFMSSNIDVAGCFGTAGTYGTAGTVGGCVGTFGSLGSYGCLG